MQNDSNISAQQSAHIEVLRTAIDLLNESLDAFIGACVDENGNPKAPDKRALMDARKMLPAQYRHTMIKAKP